MVMTDLNHIFHLTEHPILSVLGMDISIPADNSSMASDNSEVVAWDGSLGESSNLPLYTTTPEFDTK